MSPSAPFPVVTTPRGVRHALVPATNVEAWCGDRAYDALMTAMRNDDFAARQLAALARDRGCFDQTPEAVARWLAQEVGRGLLIPVAHRDPSPARGRPVLGYEGFMPDDWSELTPLSALREREPTVEFGWLGIELVDHDGVPFAGYELTLVHCDGRRDRVVLDENGRHRARAVALPGPTLVGFPKHVVLPESARHGPPPDGFAPHGDDVAVPREPKAGLFLKQLDRAYRLVLEAPSLQPPAATRPARPSGDAPNEVTPSGSTTEYGWVSIELVSDRGVPFAGAEVTLLHCNGRRDSVVLDALGRHAAPSVPLPGPSEVILPGSLLLPAGALALDGFVRRADDIRVPRRPGAPVTLRLLDRHHRLVVQAEPSVTEIIIDGWAQGSRVMRWGGMRPRSDGTVSTTRAALRLGLSRGRGRTMCVAGHADPLGQDADNETLSAERGKSLYLFAAGKLDEWADHAAAQAAELDVRCALVACHAILGLGPASLDDAQALTTARSYLRSEAGLADGGPIGTADWRAIADLYDADLAPLLATDRAGLAEIRSTIRWTEPPTQGLGERHPCPTAEIGDAMGPAALPHRRGSLLVFDDPEEADAAAHAADAIYDGTYRRTLLPVPSEVLVQLVIARPSHESIARARAWIDVATLGASQYVADVDGTIRFVALAGDRINLIAAFDADGLGALVSSGMATP